MKKTGAFALSVMVGLAGCAELNPYDRSEYEKAEEPISEKTNPAVARGMNSGQKQDNNGWGDDTKLASGDD